MISLTAGNFGSVAIYDECVLLCDEAARIKFANERPYLIARAEAYEALAPLSRLHELPLRDPSHATPDELENLYSTKLSSASLYDRYKQLRAVSPHMRCPYCGWSARRFLNQLL